MKYQFIVTAEWASRACKSGGCDYTCRVYQIKPNEEYGFVYIGESKHNSNSHAGVVHEGWQIVVGARILPRRIMRKIAEAQKTMQGVDLRYGYRPSVMVPMGVWIQEIK